MGIHSICVLCLVFSATANFASRALLMLGFVKKIPISLHDVSYVGAVVHSFVRANAIFQCPLT